MPIFSFPVIRFACLATVLSACPLLAAAPTLSSATITFIQKDVSFADVKIARMSGTQVAERRKASLQETVQKNNAVITGDKSRAELRFNDGSIARLGQFTSFTFREGTRTMQLSQGSGLFRIPPGMGGTSIQAGAITASVTGTILLLQVSEDSVVLYVYEGSVVMGGKTVKAGQLLRILTTGGTESATFDITEGHRTAALFTRFVESPSQPLFLGKPGELLPAVIPRESQDERQRDQDRNPVQAVPPSKY